ncbi:hypothetical protein JOL62DRAFT_618008 [Phyllosticta paracitricarpa]|uniref:Uncharacterized protein n=2 Tax=Phyllosticta TaxID=121621 RepID=A0ABR1NB61_9PEZI
MRLRNSPLMGMYAKREIRHEETRNRGPHFLAKRRYDEDGDGGHGIGKRKEKDDVRTPGHDAELVLTNFQSSTPIGREMWDPRIRTETSESSENREDWPTHPVFIKSDIYVTVDDAENKRRRISDLAVIGFQRIMRDPGWRNGEFGNCDASWVRKLVVYTSRILTRDGLYCVSDTVFSLRRYFDIKDLPAALQSLRLNDLEQERISPSADFQDFMTLSLASNRAREINRIKDLLRGQDDEMLEFMGTNLEIAWIIGADRKRRRTMKKWSAEDIIIAWAAMQVDPKLNWKNANVGDELDACVQHFEGSIAFGQHMLKFEERFSKAIFLLFPPGWVKIFFDPLRPKPALLTQKIIDDLCKHCPELPGVVRQLQPIVDILTSTKPFSEQSLPKFVVEDFELFDGMEVSLDFLLEPQPIDSSSEGSDSNDSSCSSEFASEKDEVSVSLEYGEEDGGEVSIHPRDLRFARAAKSARELLRAPKPAEFITAALAARRLLKAYARLTAAGLDLSTTTRLEAARRLMMQIFRALLDNFIRVHQGASAPPITSKQETAVDTSPDGSKEEVEKKSQISMAEALACRDSGKSAQAKTVFRAILEHEIGKIKNGEAPDKMKVIAAGMKLTLVRWSENDGISHEALAKVIAGLNEIQVPSTNGSKSGDIIVESSGDSARTLDDDGSGQGASPVEDARP